MYRPQFPYGCPAGFEDGDFDYYFDSTNTPLLNNTALASGGIIQNVPLALQMDAPFALRGIQVKGINGADPVVAVQFKDPFENYLSDDYVPLDLAYAPDSTAQYFCNIVIEPEIRCPAGGVWWVSIKNQTNATQDITKVRIVLSGNKRYVVKGVKCA
jgi:hypothetical protein